MKNQLFEKLQESLDLSFDKWFDHNNTSLSFNDFLESIGAPNENDLDEEILRELDELSSFDIKKQELVKQYALEYYNRMIDLFFEFLDDSLTIVDDSCIKIFRKMIISKSNLDLFLKGLEDNNFGEYSGIGVCWSYDIKAAQAHWGMNFKDPLDITLVGLVDINQINIQYTGLLNLDISIGLDEKEIRLNNDAYINITEIHYEDVIQHVDFLTKA